MTQEKDSCSTWFPSLVAISAIAVAIWQSGIGNDFIPPEYKDWKRTTISVMDDVTFMDKYSKIAKSIDGISYIRESNAGVESLTIKSDYMFKSEEEARLVELQLLTMLANDQGQYGITHHIATIKKEPGVLYLDNTAIEVSEGKFRVVIVLKYQNPKGV
jgi:hypothetical protein